MGFIAPIIGTIAHAIAGIGSAIGGGLGTAGHFLGSTLPHAFGASGAIGHTLASPAFTGASTLGSLGLAGAQLAGLGRPDLNALQSVGQGGDTGGTMEAQPAQSMGPDNAQRAIMASNIRRGLLDQQTRTGNSLQPSYLRDLGNQIQPGQEDLVSQVVSQFLGQSP